MCRITLTMFDSFLLSLIVSRPMLTVNTVRASKKREQELQEQLTCCSA